MGSQIGETPGTEKRTRDWGGQVSPKGRMKKDQARVRDRLQYEVFL